MNAAICVRTPPPGDSPQVRRVVVVPSLWAPFHHQPSVAALVLFTQTVQPDGLVFMNAPGDRPTQARQAFMNVLATFRTAYQGSIVVHSLSEQRAARFAHLNAATVLGSVPVAPGWRAASIDLNAQPDLSAHVATAGANVVCGGTGRLRLTGRAVPAGGGTMRAWLVFECGTLAADPTAGTLGFGILETDGAIATARPVRVGTDGSFTYRGTLHQPVVCAD